MTLNPATDEPGDVITALAESCGETGWKAEAAQTVSELIVEWWRAEGFRDYEMIPQSPAGQIDNYSRRSLHRSAVRFVRDEMMNRRPRGAPRFLPGFVIVAIITAIISYAVEKFLDYVLGNRRVAAALAQ